MLILVPGSRRHHQSHSPPEYRCQGQRKLLLFFLKCVIMVFAISLFLFFLGFAAVVLIHFLFLSNTFSRRCNRQFRSYNAAGVEYVDQHALSALPVVNYSAAAYPRMRDCAICLDCLQEGDECRSLPACDHFFHAECVDKWILKKPTCPICRTRIVLNPSLLPGDDRRKRLLVFDFEGSTSY